MTRREMIFRAFLPLLAQKSITTTEQPEAKAMDKHCPVDGIKGENPFRLTPVVTNEGGVPKLTVVQEFCCQQCGNIFGYDKNDAGRQ